MASLLGWTGIIAGGTALGLSVAAGLSRRTSDTTVPKPSSPSTSSRDVDATVLEQHLVRIGMHGKALAEADMARAIVTATRLGLPKTAATLQAIARDGKPGGPNYVPLPLDENWPGTNVSVRAHIANVLAALKPRT